MAKCPSCGKRVHVWDVMPAAGGRSYKIYCRFCRKKADITWKSYFILVGMIIAASLVVYKLYGSSNKVPLAIIASLAVAYLLWWYFFVKLTKLPKKNK